MTPETLTKMKDLITKLLKHHRELMDRFIPAKAGLDQVLAKALSDYISKIEKAIRDLENASTNDELEKAINAANDLFSREK